jgi:hypothetical protein
VVATRQMLRCSTRSLGLLSRALAGQTQCHGTALATVKQHAHTSLRQLHTKQRIRAVLNEAVCPQQQAQQQQLLKLSRQITCSAAAASWSFVQTPADALVRENDYGLDAGCLVHFSVSVNNISLLPAAVAGPAGLHSTLCNHGRPASRKPAILTAAEEGGECAV